MSGDFPQCLTERKVNEVVSTGSPGFAFKRDYTGSARSTNPFYRILSYKSAGPHCFDFVLEIPSRDTTASKRVEMTLPNTLVVYTPAPEKPKEEELPTSFTIGYSTFKLGCRLTLGDVYDQNGTGTVVALRTEKAGTTWRVYYAFFGDKETAQTCDYGVFDDRAYVHLIGWACNIPAAAQPQGYKDAKKN